MEVVYKTAVSHTKARPSLLKTKIAGQMEEDVYKRQGGAESTHILTSIHTLFSPYSELLYEFLVRICNQWKG